MEDYKNIIIYYFNVKATMIDYLQFFTELEFQNQIDI